MPKDDGDKVVIARRSLPRQTTRIQRARTVVKPPAAAKPAPTAGATSRAPLVLFMSLAFVALSIAAAALMIHVLTGGRQTEFSDDILNRQLVAVEPAENPAATTAEDASDTSTATDSTDELPDITRPNMIDLSGDPILVRRGGNATRQVVKYGDEAKDAGRNLKLSGDLFRLTDNLATADSAIAGMAAGSQLGFAFAQNNGEADTSADTGSADGQPATAADATVINVGADAAEGDAARLPARHTLIKQVDADIALSALLAADGFDDAKAKEAEAAAAALLNVPKLAKGFGVAALGYRPDGGAKAYVPAQITIYKDGASQGTIALDDNGTYTAGADPWLNQNIFDDSAGGGEGKKLRLLDAIYAAIVRNNISASVAGEIIQLMSRQFDLEQPVAGDESLTVIFASRPRNIKTGLGRILFVKIDRGSGDGMECYVFQAAAGAPFECVAGSGAGSAAGGMVTPVKGVIVSRFGPGRDPATRKRRMNTGVDWTAPPGSPVVAAFAGKITFAASDANGGKTVKIAHDNGTATVYANLAEFAAGIAPGATLRAGQRLGLVGPLNANGQWQLHFELLNNGQPVDPFGEYQSRVEAGGAIETLVYRITTVESRNDCNAANPLSTAVGLGQFIESTWLRIIHDYHPELAQGKTRAQILALRTQCDLAREMTTALTREDATYIRAAGQAVTPGNLYLAHFLGPGGAISALQAKPSEGVANVVAAGVVKANPFLAGMTAANMIDWAAHKMARGGKVPPASAGQGSAAGRSFAANSAFTQFRSIIDGLLNG